MVSSSVLGFPRIGANREVKKAVEAYWAGKISADELQEAAAKTRKASWTSVKEKGVTYVPSGEFTLYDHVLDHSAAFNVIPARYQGLGISDLDVFFAMGRGRQADGVDVPASEMKKWFDSNYHYVVPEFSESTDIKLLYNKALAEYKEAKAAGVETRPVLLGPLSFLILGKNAKEAKSDFDRISLLPKLLPVYEQVLSELKAEGAEWVQVDEPVLVLDIAEKHAKDFATAYEALSKTGIKVLLTTYFGRLDSNVNFIAKLPIAGLHIDLDRAPGQLDNVIAAIKGTPIVLSLGLVSGRNIWKNDFAASIKLAQKAADALVIDLEKAGIHAIQVDEPAIREGLPLRRVDWDAYLTWAVDSFRLATAGVGDATQTHSHFCYSDFNDIFPSIQRLDADVISVEASKSDLKLLGAFKQFGYSNEIGPGVYDIHSPRVPSEKEIKDRIAEFLTLIKPELLFVNPDCGLKTRGWKETEASLTNLVAAARWAREQHA
ncbi:methionine-synthesizing 5- methyltetrahydropteroyltriglutamate--homocysteine methyltransferase [Ceratobasidium sp. UAMH 11750]|nr:methionine-synthesizing 5- methyltetrahydropteroyltriglutamate--homocysteine methyltransferase [Ceratobasidium sp. UAMH 11750]